GKTFIPFSQIFFEKKFNPFFSLIQPQYLMNFALIAGAKVAPFYSSPNYFQTIFCLSTKQ
ncbi:hypothetical protein, partial [Flavobacterium sp.]|uniref:hypothetical protein n=1 Tax=Flavobacterium sp. TaxID=239 RepID=UPI001AD05CCB